MNQKASQGYPELRQLIEKLKSPTLKELYTPIVNLIQSKAPQLSDIEPVTFLFEFLRPDEICFPERLDVFKHFGNEINEKTEPQLFLMALNSAYQDKSGKGGGHHFLFEFLIQLQKYQKVSKFNLI